MYNAQKTVLIDPTWNHLYMWVYMRSLSALLPCLLDGFPQQSDEGGQSDEVSILPVSLHPWNIMPQVDILWGWDGLSKIDHPYVYFAAAVVDKK